MRHLFSLLFLSIAFVSFPWRSDSAIVRTGEEWILSTGQSTLMLRVEGQVVYPVYFGATHSATSDWKQYRLTGHGSRLLEEVPVRGGHANKLPIVEAVFPDGTRDIELEPAGEDRALLLCYDLAEFGGTLPGSLELPSRIRLKGLDPSSVYEVSSGGRVAVCHGRLMAPSRVPSSQ